MLAAGKTSQAVEYLKKSLLINPDDVVVCISIAIAYIKTGNYEQAFRAWARAEQLQRNSRYVLNNPAWMLVTADDVTADDADNAVEFSRRACEMTKYKNINLLDTLAAAYAAAGRFDDAVKTAQKAVDTAKTGGQNTLAEEIKERMELYRADKRYIQK